MCVNHHNFTRRWAVILKLRVKSAVSYMIVGYNDYDVTWWQNDLIFRLRYLDEHAYIHFWRVWRVWRPWSCMICYVQFLDNFVMGAFRLLSSPIWLILTQCLHGRCSLSRCILLDSEHLKRISNRTPTCNLAYVLCGLASPSLLDTYDEEQRDYAVQLIDFYKHIVEIVNSGRVDEYQKYIYILFKQNSDQYLF